MLLVKLLTNLTKCDMTLVESETERNIAIKRRRRL